MSTIQKIDHHPRAGDRRTAFTALLAENRPGQEEYSAPCLTVEELAWLVDNPAAGSEQERFFNHLAACNECWQQWLELSRIMAEEQGRAKQGKATVTPLFTAGRLAWAGSFLAAAASVVLFLNIQQDAGIPVLKKSSTVQGSLESANLTDSVAQEFESPAVLTPQAESMVIEESLPEADAEPLPESPAPAPPQPAAEAPVNNKKRPSPTGMAQEKAVSNAARREPTVQSMGMDLERMGTIRGGFLQSESLPTAASWLSLTAAACDKAVQGEYISNRFWQEQYLAGKKMVAADHAANEQIFSSDRQRKRVVMRLASLRLLADPDQLLPVCRAILDESGSDR